MSMIWRAIFAIGTALFLASDVGSVKLLILKEENGTIWENVKTEEVWEEQHVILNRENEEESFNKVCEELSSGAWMVLDLTWSGWDSVAEIAGIRYLRADLGISPFMRATELTLIKLRNSTDAALIFQHSHHFEQSLWYLVRESSLRVTVHLGLDDESAESLLDMRPSPSSYVIFADHDKANTILKKAVDKKLVYLDDRWAMVFMDIGTAPINKTMLKKRIMQVYMPKSICCTDPGQMLPCHCTEPFNFEIEGAKQLKIALSKAISSSLTEGLSAEPLNYSCSSSALSPKNDSIFYDNLDKALSDSWLLHKTYGEVRLNLRFEIRNIGENRAQQLGNWDPIAGIRTAAMPRVKRFFRIGTGFSTPFAYPTNQISPDGSARWEGYALDLIERLAESMKFEYQLITVENHMFGQRFENGSWNGLVGMLATGRVDMVVGSLTMTSEREEVIDFVAPYFEQTGFSIVLRKPLKKTSLFKFMTVLRVEVWLSILGALCLTALMIWFLDRYSPYSARNNKEKYPYPCRDFTLKESFWFAVTSFTPQGGGEAPKSLSARTLVAAYWLFVVLMLATFTANLAAFLTVERMQSPVQSLKHLARQSRINYTVVKDSDAHNYFRNMKFAEETLYKYWKEITLNSSSDQSQFRVWDYPIKEQYGHILNAIEKAGPVANIQEGLRKVIESEQAEFALIHDLLELKYHVFKNCNLTLIGEPFAEQPYAVAVQQGSHLNEEISRRILDLQRERFFEATASKYWNSTIKSKCDNVDEDEGITLESLGGVFIATLVGLFIALLTLGAEVWYHKKKSKNQVTMKGQQQLQSIIRDEIFTTKEFGHHNFANRKASLLATKPKVKQITVYPRGQLY
ncbi:ionotropic receptor 25a [Halyomorpha halys]|uniref:ionotropic receptor 25a n=1 Tax=Halyomorpha halys TaxID=286706 RepID=UPI0034D1C657